jgi:hypothetical protein
MTVEQGPVQSRSDAAEGVKSHGVAWLKRLLAWATIVTTALALYVLSLGPVMRHYRDHQIPKVVGVGMFTIGGRHENPDRRSVIVPKWVRVVYGPGFGFGRYEGPGLRGVYSRYLVWWIDGKASCRENLRQMDEAKRQWAVATKKSNGATPFADHILEYLPKHTMPKCPNGGTYRFNPVGVGSDCSVHKEL